MKNRITLELLKFFCLMGVLTAKENWTGIFYMVLLIVSIILKELFITGEKEK